MQAVSGVLLETCTTEETLSTGSGLATAFFRLYVLHALERGSARPASILASLHSSEGALPLEGGTFSRAVQQLLDAGLVLPASSGAIDLTPMGRREREAQRQVWQRIVNVVARLLAGDLPTPEPPDDRGLPQTPRTSERVPDNRAERVVLAEIREAARRARDFGECFGVALAEIAVVHDEPMRARAMLQRALRETLGRAAATFGTGTRALRCGPQSVCLIVPGDAVEAQAELLRVRILESLGAMSATARSFAGSHYAVRVGAARWSSEVVTSSELLRLAGASLAANAAVVRAA